MRRTVLRIFSVFGAALALSACQSATAPTPAELGTVIDCALGKDGGFKPVCSVERSADSNGALLLILHHPDGGFRRLLVTTDGRGVVAADGASPAQVTMLADHLIEVAVDEDRYHLPASVKQ